MKDTIEIINSIRTSFSGVTLEDGVSLNMTEYHDSGGTCDEFKKNSESDEREDWGKLSRRTLESFTVTFSFTDLKGFRFYAPAYMISCLENYKSSDSIIDDKIIYALDPGSYHFKDIKFTEWFTQDQVKAIMDFLQFAIESDDSLDSRVAEINLNAIKDEILNN